MCPDSICAFSAAVFADCHHLRTAKAPGGAGIGDRVQEIGNKKNRSAAVLADCHHYL
jgi:hypothetical protein